jgi:glutamyl-tRNA reductase
MPLLALGVSYRRAPVELLDRLAIGEDDLTKAYQRLADLESAPEAVVLSTCNRVEVYAEVTRYHQGFQDLKRFLSEHRDVPAEEFAEPLYSHYEEQCVEHLFSVASGIDSMVIGEPQILSQVRRALRLAEAEGGAGPILGEVFRYAARVGARARRETAIGASPASFVEAGASLAEEFLGDLSGARLLVVGAGKMSEIGVGTFQRHGVGPVRILNRTPERAERVARATGGDAGPLESLEGALREADVVVCSTGATGIVIGAGLLERATAGRDGRPLFVLDLAVPRDVDPQARTISGVRVVDIDDLRSLVADGAAPGEVEKVRAIVAEEARKLITKQRAARFARLIAALHELGEGVRAKELERISPRLARLSERERQNLETLTRGIVKKLLHGPVVRLKDLAGRGAADAHARALAELFGLEDFLEE